MKCVKFVEGNFKGGTLKQAHWKFKLKVQIQLREIRSWSFYMKHETYLKQQIRRWKKSAVAQTLKRVKPLISFSLLENKYID